MVSSRTPGLISSRADAMAFLDARIGHGVQPGLDRIEGLLDLMTNPQLSYPVIHVAGTNGKTTAVRMIASLLEAHGLRVGTFTSPHLRTIEERFSIAGAVLSEPEFVDAVADVAPFVEIYEEVAGTGVTYFELTAAVALQAFAAAAVEVAVVEVGLGGRLDATNVVDAGVSVVTGIAMDHMAFLGWTLAEIAREKAGILKEGGLLVTGRLPAAAEGAFTAQVAETGSVWHRHGDDFEAEDVLRAVGGWHASVRGIHATYDELYLPLHGNHQVDNLAVAIVACELFFDDALKNDEVAAGVGTVTSPGRIQVLHRSPLVVVDGAHNVEGMEGLAQALDEEFLPADWVLVAGMRGDRDVAKLLSPLRGLVTAVVATEPGDPEAIRAEDVAAIAQEVFGPDVPVRVSVPVHQAIVDALDDVDETGAVVVAGSLYVAGEALDHFEP